MSPPDTTPTTITTPTTGAWTCWRKVGKSLQALVAHSLLFCFTFLLVLKLDRSLLWSLCGHHIILSWQPHCLFLLSCSFVYISRGAMGTPYSARQMSLLALFTPLFLLQGAGVLFAAFRLIERIILMCCGEAGSSSYLTISKRVRDSLGLLRHGSWLLGWWSINEASQEERARLFYSGSSGYNTSRLMLSRRRPRRGDMEIAGSIERAKSDVTKCSQQEFERLLIRLYFERERRSCVGSAISVVLLPCRHHILCRDVIFTCSCLASHQVCSCGETCKECPVCRVPQ